MPPSPTIYPPIQDPFSNPSSRNSLNPSRQSMRSTASYRDSIGPGEPDDSPNSHVETGFSSGDLYATSANDTHERAETDGDMGDFSRLQGDAGQGENNTRRISSHLVGGTGGNESDAMLQPPSLQPHPLAVPFQDNPEELPRSTSSISHPYSRYSSQAGASNQDLSSDDGDSQRGFNRNAMGGRRGSTLAYGDVYDDKDTPANYPTSKKSFWTRQSAKSKKFIIFGAVIAAVVVAIVAGTSISLTSKKSAAKQESSSNITGYSPETATSALSDRPAPTGVPTAKNGTIDWKVAATGGDKSTVYMADGTSFIYNNSFGGFWNSIPFNDSAQVAFDSPPLNQEWNYDTNRINGVNLGGWLVIEPFISPELFEPFSSGDGGWGTETTVIDEWTLCVALGANKSAVIEEHYATFITERDFAQIAAAGLNWVRLPVPYWIMETYPGEPFLEGVGWKYFLQGLAWARKYGLRVNLDLHAVPGSQNGYNHSSKQGTINFLNGVMGVANAQRTLNYIRILAEFISQPEYVNVVPMFSILNEPSAATIGVDNLRRFYLEVYEMIRGITGVGKGKGPMITFHDGFAPYATTVANGGWDGFLTNADRMAMDSHPYLCFAAPNTDGLSYQAAKPCSYWANDFNITREQFGVFVAGEWSLATNDCGKWINNVGNGNRYDGTYRIPGTTNPQYSSVGSCGVWDDWEDYTATTKAGLRLVAEGHMDALKDWFFWTWKTGYSAQKGKIINPFWNYQLALSQGYMPADPRIANGACPSIAAANSVQVTTNPAPTFSAWMTGGAGAGNIAPSQISQWNQFPPISMGTLAAQIPASNLPTFTPTQGIITAPPGPTPTSFPAGFSQSVAIGNGWFDPSDTALMNTPIATCTYPNAWSGAGMPAPTAPFC